MKIALVHDYIKEYGGAERVLEVLHEIYPQAPVYTSVYLPEFLGPHKERFENWDIRTSWLQKIPFKQKLISPFRLIAPWVFGQFSARGGPAQGWDLSDYDVVIVSATGAYMSNFVKTKREKRGAVHICYCHTPPRYLYGYATARDWKRHKIFAFLGAIANHFLRMADYNASKNVDYYIANSEEVAGRIEKFYRRKAKVIYPPVDILALSLPRGRESIRKKIPKPSISAGRQVRDDKFDGYYLTGGRLARAKHTDLIVKACEELGVELMVFGRSFGGYEENLKTTNKTSKLEFVGEVSDEEKLALMRGARAFIFAGEEEDFGIVPVEAMGVGLPVIAYKSGGVKETVIDGKTGMFFEELSVESLKKAIKEFEKIKFDPKECIKQAGKFGKERFVKEIMSFVTVKMKNVKL